MLASPYISVLIAIIISRCSDDPGHGHQPETNIDYLALNITSGLVHSEVLGKWANFTFHHLHDVVLGSSKKLLARAGIDDASLPEEAAHSGEEHDNISSETFFRTIGYEMAKFLDFAGLVEDDNVIPFANMVVKCIELEACINGVSGPQDVNDAIVYGLYDVMESLGLANKDKMVELFRLFEEELDSQTKDGMTDIPYEVLRIIKYRTKKRHGKSHLEF